MRFLGEQMRDVEQNMRLATLLARQYYLPLEVGRRIALPIIDLNPRLGIVFTPQRFVGDRAVCKVQFLEPEGPSGSSDFTGEPITLSLKDADLQQVLEVFSKIAPVEIIVEPSVTGSVTGRSARCAVGPGPGSHPPHQRVGLGKRGRYAAGRPIE